MKKIVFVLISFICYNAFGQVYSFKNYTEDDGLSQSFINDINQDDRGFLYIATGNGLSIYSGNSFKKYNKARGLSNDFVTTLFKDSKNDIWLGHLEGKVSVLHHSDKVEKINFKEEIGSKIIQIVEVSPNNYVFLKNNTGLITYNSSNGAYTNIENDDFNEVLSLIVIKDELLLLKSDGVYSINIQNLLKKNYALKRTIKLKEGVLMRLNVAKDKIIIADNVEGILILPVIDKTYLPEKYAIKKNDGSVYKKIISDRFSNVYVSTTDNGIFKIITSNKTILNFTTKNGLSSNTVESIFVDREDNLWIGTYGNGLQQLNNELYSYSNIIDEEGHNLPVNSIVKINNRILVATKKGIGYFHDDKVDFIKSPLLSNKNINCLILHNNEFIFSSFEGELFKSDTLFKTISKIKLLTTNAKLLVNSLNADDKNIYACTTSGLYVVNALNNQTQLLNTEAGLLHNNIRFIFIDSKKHMWICSPGTLIYYLDDLSIIKKFEDVAGLEKFNTTVVCEDKDKNIWIATIGDGVFKYDGKRFENFTTKNGLKSNYCYGIVADNKNGIWVSHTNGISYKNKNKKNFNKITTSSETLQTRFIENSFFYDRSDYNILFGTSEGFSTINTNKQRFNEVEPALSILNISLNDDKLKSFNDTVLKYNSYDLTIDFSAVCLTDPSNVRYRYKLEGLQDNWEFLTRETRRVQFPKLKDGEYKFMIYASNNDDLWNSKPVIFKISIKIPFWKNYWFYILLTIVICFLFYGFIKFRTKKLLEEQKKLEGIIVEKTSEIVKEKEKVEKSNKLLEKKNEDITASITYAKRIQSATLSPIENITEKLNAFILFRPRDIVSGDFYWCYETKEHTYIAAVDCTGHGVPGAFMSLIGSTFLNQIMIENKEPTPSQILFELDKKLFFSFKQKNKEEQIRDGMDMGICRISREKNEVIFSGANRPFYFISNNVLTEIMANLQSIGGYLEGNDKNFEDSIFNYQKSDTIYLFSDGYSDQFGGPKNKRFSMKKMKAMFEEINGMEVDEQYKAVLNEHELWKMAGNQMDDILVIGIKL